MRPEDSLPPGSYAAWTQGADLPSEDPSAAQRYVSGGELGRGGMGVVSAATDAWLDREVAVKRPRDDVAFNARDRMMREARITARLVHPSIVPVYDVGEDEDGPFYTMPVLVGRALEESLSERDLAGHIRVLTEVSRAMGYAHTEGIVHRDLKPSNVLLGHFGEVWVLDWGVAFDARLPDATAVGTRGYQAPEQARGELPTPAADVFSLGRILERVLETETVRHPELQAVAARCLQSRPSERYVDGSALAEELESWLEGRRVEAHAYSAAEVLRRFVDRWRAPLLVGWAAVVLGAALGLVALKAQKAERDRADSAMAMALAQQAVSWVERGARPEAEVLAAHSLRLAENPTARGVFAAWAQTPRLARLGNVPTPCPRPFVQDGGQMVCLDESLRVFDEHGALLWTAPSEDSTWAAGAREVRQFGRDLIVHRANNNLEFWSEGQRVGGIFDLGGVRGIVDSPVPAIREDHRVGGLDIATGEITWTDTLCERIDVVRMSEAFLVVGCRGNVAYVGTLDEPGEPISLPGSPSAIAWVDGPIFGTFEAELLTRTADGWTAVPSGVGAVVQLEPLDDGLIAVVGEKGAARIWSARTGAFVGELPQGVGEVIARDGELWAAREVWERYALPEGSVPVSFDHAAGGGVSFLDLSPSGEQLLGGHATGQVMTWQVQTGAVSMFRDGDKGVSKAGAFRDEHSVVFADHGLGFVQMDGADAEPVSVHPSFLSSTVRTPQGLLSLSYSEHLIVTPNGGDPVAVDLASPGAAIARQGWLGDREGRVFEVKDGQPIERFTLSPPTGRMAVADGLMVTTSGADVMARNLQGEELWRWTNASGVTAVDVDAHTVAVGDRDGRISVLSREGTLLAQLPAHQRLVSVLILDGTSLYTASWDGHVRRLGLGPIAEPAADLLAQVETAWGMSLEDALTQ
ncbi:MAG: protein kinase [Proteobacteria bacterium]|nr:protein kinase [Pseudomonadota bacterium]